MSKKLQGNGLFESSRMMLPEHKEAYLAHQHHVQKQPRPQLDDQESERIFTLIAQSMQCRTEVTLVLFGQCDRTPLTGIVTKIDQQQKSIRLTTHNDLTWIHVADIIDVLAT